MGMTEGGAKSRLSAMAAAWSCDRRLRAAQKRERALLTSAGEDIVASLPLVDLPQADAQALRARIADVILQANTLDLALGHSLDKDRQDYAKASQLMRWVVVGRGFLDRWILKDRIRFHRRERAGLSHDLGVLVFDGDHESLLATIPSPLRNGVESVRAEVTSAQAERVQIVAPWNGHVLPPWLATAVEETREFVRHFWDQLSRRLFLRVPAIGALVAGWWIANHYTDSTLERIQRSMGFGGRAHLSPDTLALLKFWLPILTAAVFTYLVATIAKRVQRKYALPT